MSNENNINKIKIFFKTTIYFFLNKAEIYLGVITIIDAQSRLI
jgi:hypothetical protein